MGVLRGASGMAEEELMLSDNADVSSAIQKLIEVHGEKFERALIDPVIVSPLPNNLVILNGVEVGNLQGLNTPLRDNDMVVFLSVTHGG